MADLEQIVTFFKNLGSSDVAASISKADESLGKLKQKAGEVTDEVKRIGSSALESFRSFQEIDISVLSSLTKNLAHSNHELVSLTGQIGTLTVALKSGIRPEAFNVLSDAARESTSEIDGTIENINKLFGINPNKDNPLAKTFKTIEDLIRLGDPTKQLEMGLISTASSSGQLGDLLQTVGDDFEGLTEKAEQFSRITYELANTSGLTQKQVAGYAKQLMAIPGAMDTVIDSQEKGIADLHLLDAAMKIGTGTGVGFSRTLEDLSFQYSELGTTGKEALDYTTRLANSSQTLRMPMENIRSYTEGTARSFRYLGDNTQAAINIFERFAPTLQKSGLGVRAVSDLIGGVTQNISQMGIAQKSFLSTQTGGPGGLQGGYQIELLMKQGKVDEVYKKVEDSLRKQFGGRIVTLEEAAADNRSAGQFTKQVQLLTQGPTKIAGSEQEAYKILDVLAKGGPDKARPLTDQESSFRSALETGDKLQERQVNILTQLENQAERQVQLASITAYNTTRQLAGTEGDKLRSIISGMREKSSENLGTAEGGQLFTGIGSLEGGQMPGEVMQDVMLDLEEQTRNGRNLVSQFFSNFTTLGKMEMEKILPQGFGQQIISSAKEKAFQAKENGKEKLEMVVQAVCQKCNQEMMRSEATRIGNQIVDRRETNRALAVHTGVDHGH